MQREVQQVLFEVFGHSDSDSDADAEVLCGHAWKKIDDIPGLWVCKDFITAKDQEELVSAIDAEGWFLEGTHNQAMRFKDLPGWALHLSKFIYDAISCALSSNSFYANTSAQNTAADLPFNLDWLWRVPLFDQMIVNRYLPGEGICAHVDLLQFEDGIAILSLESACVMHFARCLPGASLIESESYYQQQAAGHIYAIDEKPASRKNVQKPVLLEPGDLVVLSGEARYDWTHEINRSEHCQMWEGETICQMRRTSITLRKLVTSKQGC